MTTSTGGAPAASVEPGRTGPSRPPAPSRAAEIVTRQRPYLFDCVSPLYDEPLAIAEVSGCRVMDFDGHKYLDAFADILTTSLGHCHPAVVAAVQEQTARVAREVMDDVKRVVGGLEGGGGVRT